MGKGLRGKKIRTVIREITEDPAARPSRPSVTFTAFIIPVVKKTNKEIAAKGF